MGFTPQLATHPTARPRLRMASRTGFAAFAARLSTLSAPIRDRRSTISRPMLARASSASSNGRSRMSVNAENLMCRSVLLCSALRVVRREVVQADRGALAEQAGLVALHDRTRELQRAEGGRRAAQACGDEMLQLADEALQKDRLVLQRGESVLRLEHQRRHVLGARREVAPAPIVERIAGP